MPQRIRIHVSGNPPSNPFQHSTGLRAVLYGWLEHNGAAIATALHDANQVKPFTLSPLGASRDGECFFDVAILTDWLSAPMLDGLSSGRREIRLGRDDYAIAGWEVTHEADWESLLGCGGRTKEFAFRILTPAAHHAPGAIRKSIVTPSPELYFGSWLNRWNLCCGRGMPEELSDVVAGRLVVSAFSGGTEAVRLERDRTFIGFTGSVRFSVLSPDTLPPDALSYLHALARFADYCGTGVDTSRGMGQTVYLG